MIEEKFTLPWQMTNWERMAFIHILDMARPEVAIEVGTYKGGSLQVLSHYASWVYSIDIDPFVAKNLDGKFDNVAFRSGDSSDILEGLLSNKSKSSKVTFILIDGDHSEEGVRKDISAILNWHPAKECIVLMHDSFNPDCRKGILTSHWNSNPYIHDVEVDFVPGIYHELAYDTAAPNTMWGGFARAVLKPFPRKGNSLDIKTSQQRLYEAVYRISSHRPKPIGVRLLRNVLKRFQRVC